jgi:L-ascorbate metabolism protein UlaG (beta-lactamase superfamily)
MKLRFIGHACVVVETASRAVIIFDPFQPNAFCGRISLRPFEGHVDAVVSSHHHLDHYHIDPSFGAPIVVDGPCQVRGVQFSCVEVPHGMPDGKDHGNVKVFKAVVDGISIIHMGDAGRPLTGPEMGALGVPDVLFVPVGGRFTMGPLDAAELVRRWSPKIAIPIHFQHRDVAIALESLDAFTGQFHDVLCADGPLELTEADLSDVPRVIVMQVEGAR